MLEFAHERAQQVSGKFKYHIRLLSILIIYHRVSTWEKWGSISNRETSQHLLYTVTTTIDPLTQPRFSN